jgi:hypothetical protein
MIFVDIVSSSLDQYMHIIKYQLPTLNVTVTECGHRTLFDSDPQLNAGVEDLSPYYETVTNTVQVGNWYLMICKY